MGSRSGSVQMNIWQSNALSKALVRQWHRFHVWRAMRMYRRVAQMWPEAEVLKARADMLMRRHAEDPQQRLDLGDD